MKKIWLFFLLLSCSVFSQQLNYGTGGNILNSENKKIKSVDAREMLAVNPAALALYNTGRQKKSWGNALFYGGFGLCAINLVNGVFSDYGEVTQKGNNYYYNDDKTSPVLAIIGGAMVLASIPIKSNYTKKVKAAISEYNKDIVQQESYETHVTLVANGQGFGFKLSF